MRYSRSEPVKRTAFGNVRTWWCEETPRASDRPCICGGPCIIEICQFWNRLEAADD